MSSRSIFNCSRLAWPVLVLLSLVSVSVALADDQDPPSRVARLSLADGSVSLQPAGVQDWGDATVNRPLTTGDKLWVDQNSRAELDLGSAAIRVGSTTGLSFLNLDDRTTQMNLTAGTAIVHVRDLADNQTFEVDTPNLAVTLQSPGIYRVQVNEAGDVTVVKVTDGEAEVNATGQTMPMQTQQAYTFTGTDQVSADAGSLGPPDSLDQWSLDRDRQAEQAESNQYVPPDVAGTQDLDQYGTWQSDPDYGYVWTPTAVAVGWSPYHFGRWVWVAPWGWTWVDDAPWGFAPFHYGRWAYIGNSWAWVPGPRHVRPVYAPALVAWIGSRDPGISVSAGVGGGVGWFPLAPHEVFVPGYHVSSNYVRNVHVTNTAIVNNAYITNVYQNGVSNITYANRGRPGAVVTVSESTFTSAQQVGGHTIRVSPGEMALLGVHGAAPPIVPVRASVLPVHGGLNVRRPPAQFANRPVVARVAPPPAAVPFERQQEAIRANGGRPLARTQVVEMEARAPNPRIHVLAPRPSPARPTQNPGSRSVPAAQSPGLRPVPAAGADRPQSSWTDRERVLHATPIPPAPQRDSPRNDRPPVTEYRNNSSEEREGQPDNGSLRNDRPPQNAIRQNDAYRTQLNDNARPQPQAHPIIPQAHPLETPRPVTEYHAVEQPRAASGNRESEPQRTIPQAHPIEPQHPATQQRPVSPHEQPRPLEPQRPGEPRVNRP
jgi:hypothetical protein